MAKRTGSKSSTRRGGPQRQQRRDGGSKRVRRNDGMWRNEASGHGTNRDPRTLTSYSVTAITDIEGMQLWRSDDVMGRIVEMKPREAMRRGFTVKVQSGDEGETDEDKEMSAAIMEECKRLDVSEKVKLAGQTEIAAGGSALFPVMDGALGDLDEELDEGYEGQIARIEALHLLEPRELFPQRWYTQLTDPKFRRPAVYRLQPLSGATGRPMAPVWIHDTRLIIFPGKRVTQQYQPGQRVGWGDPEIMRPYEAVADFGLSWGSVATLLRDFAHGVFKLHDLANILNAKDGEAQLAKRINAMQMNQSTIRAAVIDKDDEYTRITTPVGGLEGLLVQIATRVALAADIPVTLLFGMSPAGLNATGESDMRGWYDRVEAARARYEHMIRQIVRLIMLQSTGPCGGVEPEHWSIEFPPLWQPSEKEEADRRFIVAQTDKIYSVDIGAVNSRTIAESRWKGGVYSADMHIDWEEFEAQQALDIANVQNDNEALAAMGRKPGEPMEPTDDSPVESDGGNASAVNVPDEPREKAPPSPSQASAAAVAARKVKVREHERTVG